MSNRWQLVFWVVLVLGGIYLLMPSVSVQPPMPGSISSRHNIQQLSLGVRIYHQIHGQFPVDIKAEDGKPLLSWRVRLLPLMEEPYLYDKLHLDEPWDSEHNQKFHKRMPEFMAHPAFEQATEAGRTAYLRPLHPSTVFGGESVPTLEEIPDGAANTIHLIEVPEADAVPWMKPADYPVEPKDALKELLPGAWSVGWKQGFYVTCMDCSAHLITKEVDSDTFAGWLTANGGEGGSRP